MQRTVTSEDLSYARETILRYHAGHSLTGDEHARVHDIGYRLFHLNVPVAPAVDGPNKFRTAMDVKTVANSLLHYNQPRDILTRNLMELPALEKELSGLAQIVSDEKH